ncbi:hypothetical protein BH23BAC1_BH23BAC1_28950 [soil metagenome]
MKYLLCLLIIITFSGGIMAQSYKVQSTGGLNLRESSGKDGKIISTLPPGAQVTVIDKSNDKWWKVKFEGKTGYVSSEFLRADHNKSSGSNNQSSSNDQQKTEQPTTSSSRPVSGSGNSTKETSSKSYNWGLGFRLGDPFGITLKRYLARNRAFEINVGSTSHWGYNYRNRFYHYNKYKDYDYRGYNNRGAVSIQFHYLYHKNIKGAEGLQWYLGFGPQVRIKRHDFQYRFRSYYGPGPNDYNWLQGRDTASDLDVGLDGIIGLEYKFKGAPFSVFGETNLFMEILDRPFYFRGQGGLGARFNF